MLVRRREGDVSGGQLAIQLLGSPRVAFDDCTVKIETRKGTALLAYLAVTGEIHQRDALATMLWPESDSARARGALRRSLAALRKTPVRACLNADRDTIAIRKIEGYHLDVEAFQRRLERCKTHGHGETEVCSACLTPLIEAVTIYRNDFMIGFSLGNCPVFDDWQFFTAESLRGEMISALDRLVHYLAAQGQFESAIAYARRWLAYDPLHEPAHRQLMQLYAWTGQRSAALRQYQECVRILDEELGLPPLEETTQLFHHLRDLPDDQLTARPVQIAAQVLPVHIASSPAASAAMQIELGRGEPEVDHAAPNINIPQPSTKFIGREAELAEVRRLLTDPDCRLLTLLGPGGMGKTRLSIQAVKMLKDNYKDGVFYIPLAPLTSTTALIYSMADVLRFSFYSNREPQEDLLDYLREKEMLLLLDNFEHLLVATGFVESLLQVAPGVRMMITSRERLNLSREWVFELHGLDVPVSEETQHAEDYSAVQLFRQSVARQGGKDQLTTQDLDQIARICRLMGGIPLGIELAAAWTRLLSFEEIAQEIEHNLDFLVASSRDFPDRHQSLRAVFEHSWRLLTLEEQRVFRRMSVFRGGFQRKAAERVAGASLAVLSSLADKSLIFLSHDRRYDMHVVLRQYAEEKLHEVLDEEQQTKDRHCQYYAEFLHSRSEHLRLGKQEEASRSISEEIENLRRGWRWACERRSIPEIEKYIHPQFTFYEMRSWFVEGEEIYGLAAKQLRGDSGQRREDSGNLKQTLAKVLSRQGSFAYRLGEYRQARQLLEESLAISRELDFRAEMAFSLSRLGEISRLLGEFDDARHLLVESVRFCQETGEIQQLGRAYNSLAIVEGSTGDYGKAEALFRESINASRKVGDLLGIGKARENLGSVAYLRGDFSKAKELYEESLLISRGLNSRYDIASCLNNMGVIAHEMGQYEQAIELHKESEEIYQEIGSSWNIGICLNDLGKATLAMGDLQEAEVFFHAAFKAAVETGAIPISLSILVSMAELLMQQGNPQRALECLLIVVSHPGSEQETRDRAERLFPLLEKQISPSVIAKGRERLRNRYLRQFILLAEEILKAEEVWAEAQGTISEAQS